MKEQKISFETAELAYSKDFHEFGVDFDYLSQFKNTSKIDTFLPTQSLLQRWLRDTHQLFINIDSTLLIDGTSINHSWDICYGKQYVKRMEYTPATKEDGFTLTDKGNYNSYEKALEIGLQNALNIIP